MTGIAPPSAAGIILLLICAAALWRTAANFLAARWLLRAPVAPPAGPLPPFVILLPALREQTLVEETIDHFAGLDYPYELMRIVIIATERERLQQEDFRKSLLQVSNLIRAASADADPVDLLTGHLPKTAVARLLVVRDQLEPSAFETAVAEEFDRVGTTYQLALEKSRSFTFVQVVEAPQEWALKAGQLKYALENIDNILCDWPELPRCQYVGVYDFDGRPARNTLRWAARAAESQAVLLQQPGLTVPDRTTSRMGVSFAGLDGQLHARLALRLELQSLLLDRFLARLARPVRATLSSGIHAIGNGLFINRAQLASLGGIPEPVDDLALGWRAAATGRRIEPIRSPTFYAAYPNERQAANSRAFICRGYLLALKDTRRVSDRVGPARVFQLARIYDRLLQWAVGPFLRVVLLGYALTSAYGLTALVAVVTYLLFIFDIGIVHRVYRATLPPGRPAPRLSASGLLLSPVALLWYGAGPRRALLAALIRRDKGTYTKTER